MFGKYIIQIAFSLLLMLCTHTLTSCTDANDGKQNEIIGTWERESISPSEVDANSVDVQRFIYSDIKSYNRRTIDSYIFSKNERVLFIDSTYSEESMYQLSDTAIIFSYPNGETIKVPATILGDRLSLYTDETQYYQDWIDYLFPEKKIEITKVLTKYTYRRR